MQRISNTKLKQKLAEEFNNSEKAKTPYYLEINEGPNRKQRRSTNAIKYKDHASNRSKPYVLPNTMSEDKKYWHINNGIKIIHNFLARSS